LAFVFSPAQAGEVATTDDRVWSPLPFGAGSRMRRSRIGFLAVPEQKVFSGGPLVAGGGKAIGE